MMKAADYRTPRIGIDSVEHQAKLYRIGRRRRA
jgi:hypothetical protein